MHPEQIFKIGSTQASVFLNEVAHGDEKKLTYSVNLQRRYQVKETQEWKSNSVFRLAELPQALLVLEMATKYVAEREAAQNGSKSDSGHE